MQIYANLQMPGSSPVSFWYSPTFFFKLLNAVSVIEFVKQPMQLYVVRKILFTYFTRPYIHIVIVFSRVLGICSSKTIVTAKWIYRCSWSARVESLWSSATHHHINKIITWKLPRCSWYAHKQVSRQCCRCCRWPSRRCWGGTAVRGSPCKCQDDPIMSAA